jgi:hypothetical protein
MILDCDRTSGAACTIRGASVFRNETFRLKSVVLLVLLAGAEATGFRLDIRGGCAGDWPNTSSASAAVTFWLMLCRFESTGVSALNSNFDPWSCRSENSSNDGNFAAISSTACDRTL